MVILIVFSVIVVSLLCILMSKAPAPITVKIALVLLIGIAILLTKLIKGFIPLPVGIRHAINLVIQPKDIDNPIILDEFRFFEKGFAKTYLLKPKYLDLYEVGIYFNGGSGPSKYKFEGKLKVEFFLGSDLLFEEDVTGYKAAYLTETGVQLQKISLFTFGIPVMGKYKDNVSVKVTVLTPDAQLKAYADSLRLYIAVAAVP